MQKDLLLLNGRFKVSEACMRWSTAHMLLDYCGYPATNNSYENIYSKNLAIDTVVIIPV